MLQFVLRACLLIALSAPAFGSSTDFILWNRNYDTAPIDRILELAFEKTEELYGPVNLVRSDPMEQGPALTNLANGNGLDLLSAAASSELEERFQVVRFPLLKGLLGHRICLIRKNEQNRFEGIRTAHDFNERKLSVCQGEHWPDTPVLARNGITLKTSTVYRQLFDMLRNEECDCFLRGAQEIAPEHTQLASEFDIEESLVVLYQQPGLLYVNKDRKELAARIELGLLRALDDGSFDALFSELLGSSVAHLNMENRHYINLVNPFVPSSLSPITTSKEIWFQP